MFGLQKTHGPSKNKAHIFKLPPSLLYLISTDQVLEPQEKGKVETDVENADILQNAECSGPMHRLTWISYIV